MIKLLSTEDTLPVIAEKCKYAWTPSKLKEVALWKTRCLISRTIGSYLLRVANLNAKAMFLNIQKQNKPLFFASKSRHVRRIYWRW
jgi:hypothetical protein